MECSICNKKARMSDVYDSYYCEECDIWLSKRCTDMTEEEKEEMYKELTDELAGMVSDAIAPECCYCTDRPERPSEAEKLHSSYPEE